MSGYILQVVWPVVDETFGQPELIEEAAEQVHEFAASEHCEVTGPGVWWVDDGRAVPGWESWDGLVLVGRFPAEPDPAWQRWRGGCDVDPVKVEMAVDGKLEWERLGQAEKTVVLRALWEDRTAEEIARLLRAKVVTIRRARARDLARERELAAELAS